MRQVSTDTSSDSVAARHGPPSTRISTLAIPVCCAHAMPATVTVSAVTLAKPCGTSIRVIVLIGPSCDQPRCSQ